MSKVRLIDIAPRLGRARDQLIAEAKRQRYLRSERRRLHLKLIWLVDHRDLQLARASATGKGRYITERRKKLDQARRQLERFERDEGIAA